MQTVFVGGAPDPLRTWPRDAMVVVELLSLLLLSGGRQWRGVVVVMASERTGARRLGKWCRGGQAETLGLPQTSVRRAHEDDDDSTGG